MIPAVGMKRTLSIFAGVWLAAALCVTAAAAQTAPDGPIWERPSPVVGLVCTWSAFSTYDESIAIDLSDRVAYWVNQNKTLNILQLNAGRVVLSGVRDTVRISKNRVETEVPLRMIIDRISGAFFVQQDAFRQKGPGLCKRRRLF
jgi:hypothetical protein